MPQRKIFNPKLLQQLSLPARLATTGLLVFIAFAVRFWLLSQSGPPFLLFFPAIILAAIFLDRGSGFFALTLSTLLSWYFFVPHTNSFIFRDGIAALNLFLFVCVGVFVAAITEALHAAYVEVDKARARAEASEGERSLMLAEFSHRVKNDMQRIVSTMLLQASGSDTHVGAAIRAAADRVRVIARVHDRLAQREGSNLVYIDEYLHDLIVDLRNTIDGLRPIGLFVDSERHLLSVSRAGLIGLIVNELVTNSLKYAFPDEKREGIVRVRFRRDGEVYVLAVTDNGIGMRANQPAGEQATQASSGVGTRLVRALAAQLAGHFEIKSSGSGGTSNTLQFPVLPISE